MRRWAVLFSYFGAVAVLTAGCAGPERQYASPADFAPNSPRPLAEPRPKPTPPARPSRADPPKTVVARSDAGQESGTVTVTRGDTVYAIAHRHGRTPRSIIDANDLKPPYTLFPGQKLHLAAPRYHVVQRGETGYGISRQYDVDVTELMRFNEIKPPYMLAVGQRLQVPAGGGGKAEAPTRVAAIPDPPQRSSSRFEWPVRGRIVSGFGPKDGGRHNDGINIAAPRGTPVKAAENGVIAYAGDGLTGFGKLILIRHADGWVTAYGHNDELLVKRGDTVKRGQTIARVGASGRAGSTQLHFEIRRGTRAVDPQKYL